MKTTQRVAMVPGRALAFVAAQAASLLGSSMTTFALDVWVLRTTGSYAIFAILAVIAETSGLIIAPVAGVIVDRLPRRALIVACDLIALICVLSICVASASAMLNVVLVSIVMVLLRLTVTVRWPASAASITLLADAQQRASVNGLIEAANGMVIVLAPMLGAVLYSILGVPGIALIDVATYALCIAIISSIRFPDIAPKAAESSQAIGYRQFFRDCFTGFRWIYSRADLSRLLVFFAISNIGSSIFTVAYVPYLLSFASAQTLGNGLAAIGAGSVIGGLWFAACGGMRRHENGVVVGVLLLGACEFAVGLARSNGGLVVAALLYGASLSLGNGSNQTIWQAKVPSELQGRVFAVRRMISWGLNPLSMLLSISILTTGFSSILHFRIGPVSLSDLWGRGEAAALGLMMSLCGVGCIALVMFALFRGWFRREGTVVRQGT